MTAVTVFETVAFISLVQFFIIISSPSFCFQRSVFLSPYNLWLHACVFVFLFVCGIASLLLAQSWTLLYALTS